VGAERSAKVMANVTERVRGEREYNQAIYPYKAQAKTASAPLEGPQERDRNVQVATRDLLEATQRPAMSLEQKLSKVLDGQTYTNPGERAAYTYGSGTTRRALRFGTSTGCRTRTSTGSYKT
jgi:hypothetical protein